MSAQDRIENPSAEAWFSFQRSGEVTIDTCNSTYDTVLHVLDANSLAVLVTCDDVIGSSGGSYTTGGIVVSCEACPSLLPSQKVRSVSERLTLSLNGTEYYFVVEGYTEMDEGSFEIHADCVYAPPPPPLPGP